MLARYDLYVKQGATLHRSITWKDPAGNPVDLTGARVTFQFRTTAGTSTVALSFDSAALVTGMTILPLNTSGVIDFTISSTITAGLVFNSAVWDMFVESPTIPKDCLIPESNVLLEKAVTR
jgi:hypothetical protein